MMNTNRDVIKLAVMVTLYANNSKRVQRSGLPQLAMYAYYDAAERTALAFEQVVDGKRTADEAFERLLDYSAGLESELGALDAGGDEVPNLDSEQHGEVEAD